MQETLVLLETSGSHVQQTSLPALSFAQHWESATGAPFSLLIMGGEEARLQIESFAQYGAKTVYTALHSLLAQPVADRYACVAHTALQHTGANVLAGAAGAWGRDLLPRIAALACLPMASDILSAEPDEQGIVVKRALYAGSLTGTFRLPGKSAVLSIRATAYAQPRTAAQTSPIVPLHFDPQTLPSAMQVLQREQGSLQRPDLAAARVVVSGGRPLKNAETFERLIGGLADCLGGAAGATRAAVDSGIAPNELQVGQTGRVVAPQLYIAAGISGSLQHLAGMKESRVIAAINTDPDAPIFQAADYGLIADLYEVLPELMKKLAPHA